MMIVSFNDDSYHLICQANLQKVLPMRVSQAEMDANHRRIVEGASRLLRERGVHETSVADAMNEAGLTHGGFYRHFKTKEDLVLASLQAAFEVFAAPMESRLEATDPPQVVADYRAVYLSDEHVAEPGRGCPMPALGGEMARESVALKDAFGSGFRRVVDAVAKGMPGSPQERDAEALREVAMLVGAVVVARASDEATARRVLKACRKPATGPEAVPQVDRTQRINRSR